MQQFGNSIIPSHRRRQPVYSDARYYEIDYTRQLLERAQLARSERELRQQQGERARREDVDSGASTVAVTPTPSAVSSGYIHFMIGVFSGPLPFSDPRDRLPRHCEDPGCLGGLFERTGASFQWFW